MVAHMVVFIAGSTFVIIMTALNRSARSLEISVNNDVILQQPPTDTISCLKWSPQNNFLAVSSWDNSVRVYEIDPNTGQGQGRAMYTHDAPALSVGWWADSSKVFSGGADNSVRSYDTATNQSTLIGTHQAPVTAVCLVDVGQPMIASVSYDSTLKYWDLRSNQPVATVTLPGKAVGASSARKLLVIACANAQIVMINLDSPTTIFKTEPSLLKKPLNCIACQADGTGFAIGSIEGRCAIQYINPPTAGSNFSFKCHRSSQGTAAKPLDDVYMVNCVEFHPTYNTLATGGSDGTCHFWDKDSRHRLAYTKNIGMPFTAMAFNSQGTLLAYALGYDWAKGHQFNSGLTPTIKVHKLQDWEIKPKPRR